jgi:RND superfamily putative drug exporter
VLPAGQSARTVADVMDRSFPPNHADPIDIVIGSPPGAPQTVKLRAQIAGMPDVAKITRPAAVGAGDTILYAFTHQGPLAPQTERLVRAIRDLHPRFYLGVTGTTASFLDLESSLASHLPLVLALVSGATLILLFLMTGSVVLPLKAIAMNALTLSAMLGILVWVFQDGHLQRFLSFSSEGALDATMPVFLAAVGFGLSTDYGVFLLGRIVEAHRAGLDDLGAVAAGLERTGRIVTAAAVLFAVAIGAFVTSNIVSIKELGLGAALAVLIDASVIRALMVPSLMTLLGPANWWAPAPLRRLHDRLGLSKSKPAAPAQPEFTAAV